tara:strand:+ start:786 stop:2081 length:1296 start_codon:yes stop_codon:yes gene_type:complete
MLTALSQTIAQNRWWDAIFVLYVAAFCVDLVFLQHGRIGSELGISVRQIIFLLLMLTAAVNCFHLRRVPVTTTAGLVILGVLIPGIWGTIGIVGGNELRHVINDANGHVFYLLAFALLLGFRRDFPSGIFVDFVMLLVALLCAFSLVAYLYALTGVDQANQIETFLREGDYGFFNVFQDERPYRIFLSSYLFVPIMICIALQRQIYRWRTSKNVDVAEVVYLLLGFAVLIASQTRSLWLGLIVGVAVVLVYVSHRDPLRFLAGAIGVAALITIMSFAAVPQILRLDDLDGNVVMRFEQAAILIDLYMQRPWLGWGFGTLVDISSVIDRPPSFSHEMDLIDLLRKIGFLGLLMYIVAFALLLRAVWRQYRINNSSEEVGMLLSTIAIVFTVGFFNPYATASIGIGAIVLLLVTVEFRNMTLLSQDALDHSQC